MKRTLLIIIILTITLVVRANNNMLDINTPNIQIRSNVDKDYFFVEKLSVPTQYFWTNLSNTLILCNIASFSDGELSEIVSSACYNDFTNKPNIIILIYQTDKNILENYLFFVATEIYFTDTPINELKKIEYQYYNSQPERYRSVITSIFNNILLYFNNLMNQ